MSAANVKAPASGKGFKKLGIAASVILLLGVVAYFVVFSTGFIKGVVLPRLGHSLNARITVGDLSLSPLSSLAVRDLKVETIGTTPLLTAKEVRVRYRLWALMSGSMALDEVFLDTASLQIVPTPDGKDNLQPILEATASPSAPSSKRIVLDLHQVTVKNCSIRRASQPGGGGAEAFELANVNITLDHLAAGKAGKLILSADPRIEKGQRGNGQGKLQGEFEVTLDNSSFPQTVKGALRLLIQQATGDLQPLAGFASVVQADVTPAEVKGLGLTFEQNGKALGGFSAAGPFDSVKREGKLKLAITGIDRQILGALGAASGIDFGNTTAAGTAEVEFSKGSTLIRTAGKFDMNGFPYAQPGKTMPPVDGALAFDVNIATDPKAGKLAGLNLNQLEFKLSRAGQPAFSMQASSTYALPNGGFSAKAAIEMVADRLFGSGPSQPVKLGLSAEGSSSETLLDLKRIAMTLPQTPRANPNELTLVGRLEKAGSNASKGAFSLQATTLDLTSLYDTFMAGKPSTPPPNPAPTSFPKVEPPGAVYPFLPLSVDLRIAKVFLGELVLGDAKGTIVINGGRVQLTPFRATINGAPLAFNLDLDLAPQGYAYDIGWEMSGIPMEPLANTFSAAMKGQAKGQITSVAHVSGKGVTGKSLKEHLKGQAGVLVTNATIQVISGSQRLWFLPLDINLIASLINIPELTRSPITHIDLQATAGSGKVSLERALVRGDAFLAQAGGGIQFADVLDNSPVQIPLEVSLSRPIAQRANLLAADTPTNAVYAKLPPFASIGGTLGKLETKTDKAQILQITAQAATGLLGNRALGGGGIPFKNLGGLLGGQKSASTNATKTNASSSPNLLNLLKPKK